MSKKAPRGLAKGDAKDEQEKKPFPPQADGDADEAQKAEVSADDQEDGEDEEEGEDEAQKSLTPADLEKSMDLLSKYAEQHDGASRKEVLLSKAMAKGSLSKSENQELMALLGGEEAAPAETLGEEITKSMSGNETLQEALDVSAYLDEQHKELCKSLDGLASHIEKSDARQQNFNILLAKAVSDMGTVCKSMSERLGVIESQPARAPKSQGAQPLAKSFAGAAPSEGGLSKGQILDTMDAMLEKSGGRAECGEDLLRSIAKYEMTNQISKALLAEVQQFRAGAR